MKVSDILKKIAYLEETTIELILKAETRDRNPKVILLTQDTPEETVDLFIEESEEYTLQNIEAVGTRIRIRGIRRQKMEKKEKNNPDREQQIQEIQKEVDNLEKAVGRLIETVTAPIRGFVQRAAGRKILSAIRKVSQKIRLFLKHIRKRKNE